MTNDSSDQDAGLLEAVVELIEKDPDPRAEILESFALTYLYRFTGSSDTSPEALYHEIRYLFDFIEERTGPIAVRAFNPTQDTHGYASKGTVVEVHVDDIPFLVDSITNELEAHHLQVARVLHPVIGTERTPDGRLTGLGAALSSERRESVQHYELQRKLFPADLPALEAAVTRILEDVRRAVVDFEALLGVIPKMVQYAQKGQAFYELEEVEEAVSFLEWLTEDNFVFLGYREYQAVDTPEGKAIRCRDGSGLGILSDDRKSSLREPRLLSEMPPQVAARYEQGDLLIISKTNRLSTVHRRARMDYIGIRIIDSDGHTTGEARLLGLFTSKAYMERASRTPVLRRKLDDIARAEDLIEGSHDHKAVVAIFEGFPKDELFGVPEDDLRRLIMGLLDLQERAQVQLFVRRDLLDRSARILVAMPRERYSTTLARSLESLFVNRFGGTSVDFHLELGTSALARLHYRVWVGEGPMPDVDFEDLDERVLSMTRSWAEQVADVLARRHGRDAASRMVATWASRFPDYYTSATELEIAAGDIEHLDSMSQDDRNCYVGLQNETEGQERLSRVALYEYGKRALSDLTPALEDMGLHVVEEIPTRVDAGGDLFIHDFGVQTSEREQLDLEEAADRVSSSLTAVWTEGADSDSLARLIVVGGLDHTQVEILRAYRTYWRRVRPTFTVEYVNDTLVEHAEVTRRLMNLFGMRFDPDRDNSGYESLRFEVLGLLDEVPSLDQDRILRGFLRLIDATVRTNQYIPDRQSISFKLVSSQVPDMPQPEPHVEVFVMGREVEGVHLRAGPVARGGIRWSDRREDYRTEVLGLMKAQVTKNSVIVPTGAKGGFVMTGGRSPTRERVESAYETYIRGILDVTDNLVDGKVVHPERVRFHDGDDPYLVVAADKGTATFSDLANRIAAEYGFWLGDAFASGGSRGYDHKALGITARGAWKSLERHLNELGVDPNRDPFSVAGIGDMSGDVFGNGMLCSPTIRLVAAFDHRHVFIDPDPDPETSFQERRRLFDMEASSWDDYRQAAISKGGGVYPRSAKEISLSDEARSALGVTVASATPAELIRMILKAPVEVLWNGGIGTYVKSSTESNEDAGDRTNDQVRVNGDELRCKIVVEGGNLGLTQAGRIEYARAGGRVNTDFIDNSGGVNCSDREVNLKILFNTIGGDLTHDEVQRLLTDAAPEVVDRILADNFQQAQRISLEEVTSIYRLDSYEDLMVNLELKGLLDRAIEGLPSTEEMGERSRTGLSLSRPELAVLMAYAKRDIARELLASDFPDSVRVGGILENHFPASVSQRFGDRISDHPLRREIICTVAANEVVHSQGTSFVSQLVSRSGATVADVLTAYLRARDVADAGNRRRLIETWFGQIDPSTWVRVMNAHDRAMSTLTRWLLRHPTADTATWSKAFAELEGEAPTLGPPRWQQERALEAQRFEEAGFPAELARRLSVLPDLIHAPGMIVLARRRGRSMAEVGRVFFRVGQAVHVDALERILAGMPTTDPWNRWARQTIEDDLAELRQLLADRALAEGGERDPDDAVDLFLSKRAHALKRVLGFTRSLESGSEEDLTFFMVVVKQIETLATPSQPR
jgi:glutamate dehydrogenase